MLTVRTARVDDVPVIRELISELAEYEKRLEEVLTTEAVISRDGFGKHPEFSALIAEWGGTRFRFQHWRVAYAHPPCARSVLGVERRVELDGTVTIRPVWGGRAKLEEIEADGPKGHWEGLSLFLYNPQSHQWSQSFLNSKNAVLSGGLVGEFHDGRGELYAHDTFHDKSIFVRAVWSEITPNSHRYTESYSNDGGKTWFTSFDAHKTREKDLPPSDMAAGAEPMSADPDGHAFDFDLGTWHTQSSRLMHPLTGSTTWADLEGQTVVHRVWGGRANLAEYVGDGPAGHVQLLALRWFNPNTHEWNLDFATPNVGTLGEPGVGQCKNGRCEFYDQEEINGRQIWVRFSIWKISDDSAQSEQAFSNDGGK
jgi:hypothetical protein